MGGRWHRSPIVLVDDDPNDVLVVRHTLADAKIGNPLMVFRSADEACRHFVIPRRESPALCILDTDDTGLDFLRWLRRQAAPLGSTPAMVLTPSDHSEHPGESLDLGALFLLQKPVTPSRLVEAVQALGFDVMTSMVPGEIGFRIIQRR